MKTKTGLALALLAVASVAHAEIDLVAAKTRFEAARDVQDAQIKSHTFSPQAQAQYRMEKERFENLKKWSRQERIAEALKSKGGRS